MNLATVFNRSSPNVAAMLVIMHRHGAQACEYTRILADALCKAGQSKEAAIARTMAVRTQSRPFARALSLPESCRSFI